MGKKSGTDTKHYCMRTLMILSQHFFFFFFQTGSGYVVQVGFELKNPPGISSQVLESQACATMSGETTAFKSVLGRLPGRQIQKDRHLLGK